MVNGNELGNVGFQKLGTPYSEMDCQAFVEWCLRQCGMNKDLAGSNAWYREVMKNGAIMTPEECVQALGCVPKGAFLFILEHDGKEPEKYKPDGLGNASHIGICTIPRGEGAIHSSASRGCVAESKFRGKSINGGWNRVGLWDQVAYDCGGGGTPAPEPEPEPDGKMVAVIGNVPAENRQDVNFRVKPSTNAELIDRIKCGDRVEVLSESGSWAKVKWHGRTGYIMCKFLIYVETDPTDKLYYVTIHDLTKNEANEIVNIYGGSINEERG